MKAFFFTIITIIIVTLGGVTVAAQVRTLTDKQGRQLEAKIQDVRDESVVVLRAGDDRRFTLALNQLSGEDQDYLRAWADLRDTLRDSWPDLVRAPRIELDPKLQESESGDGFIYASPHFSFKSDVEISNRLLRHIASVFELVHTAGEELPLPINALPPGQNRSVRIFQSTRDYEAAGATKGSAGFYSYDRREILLPLSSFAVRDDAGVYQPESNPDYPTLIHEITHCVTHDWVNYAPIWALEGFARYMEVVPHTRDTLNFEGLTPRLAVWKSGNGSYHDVAILNFEYSLGVSHQQWNRMFREQPEQLRAQYTSAMVLVLYFLHLDGSDGAGFKRYLFELSQGMSQDDALDLLLKGRSVQELSQDIVDAYRAERVTFDLLELAQ